MNGFTADQVINGTWGECWIDDTYMAEVTAFKLEINANYSAITRCRNLVDGQKLTGIEPKGEVKLHKISSFVSKRISDALKQGKVPSFKIIAKLADPDAIGAERVVAYGCKFDKAILADWEAGKNGEESYSFTAEDWDYLDSI
ncbi:MAG TPA: hypothetical protein DEV97_06005 [Lachnospiraceae bacterium]|nr:hypothetical protein [Lachnospiraceae bacterium]